MKQHQAWWRRALRAVAGESGATFIEYAMLAGLIAIVVAIAVAALGKHLKGIISGTSTHATDVETGVSKANISGDFDDVK